MHSVDILCVSLSRKTCSKAPCPAPDAATLFYMGLVARHLCPCLCLGPSTANGKKAGKGREDAFRKNPGDLGGSAAQRCYSIEESRVRHPSWKDQQAEGWEEAGGTGREMCVGR